MERQCGKFEILLYNPFLRYIIRLLIVVNRRKHGEEGRNGRFKASDAKNAEIWPLVSGILPSWESREYT